MRHLTPLRGEGGQSGRAVELVVYVPLDPRGLGAAPVVRVAWEGDGNVGVSEVRGPAESEGEALLEKVNYPE